METNMQTADLSKGIVNFNKEEMKIYNFLICLSTSCREASPFVTVKNAARTYHMDPLYVPIINKHFLLINKETTTQWNPTNVINTLLINKVYSSYLAEKKAQNKLRKAQKQFDDKIPSNLIPIEKVLKQSVYVPKQKDPYGNIRPVTVDKYVRFMEIIAENGRMATAEVYATAKHMEITAELKTTLDALGLIITVGREVMWEDTIVPSKGLATRIAQYMNARIQKKELPPFDIEHYRNAPFEEKQVNSVQVQPEEKIQPVTNVNMFEAGQKVELPKKLSDTMVTAETVFEHGQTPVIKKEATVEMGSNADINMLLAQEIIAKGGDKALALKLMRGEI